MNQGRLVWTFLGGPFAALFLMQNLITDPGDFMRNHDVIAGLLMIACMVGVYFLHKALSPDEPEKPKADER